MSSEIAKRKEDLARCEDAREACFLARELGQSYAAAGDLVKAGHYLLMAGQGFVREGDVYQAIAVLCDLKETSDAEEQMYQLKNLVADTFSLRRERRKDPDADLPLPTPFQEFTASVELENASQDEVQRSQIGGPNRGSFELISSLRIPELTVLLEIASNRCLSEGDQIYREGDAPAHFYIVTRGELILTSKSGEKRVVNQGEFFGDLSCFSGMRRGATATAQGEAEVLEFVGSEFIESFKKFPNLQERVWYFFEKRLFLNIASHCALFQGLSTEELTSCYEYFTPVNAPSGRVILKADSIVQRLYFVGQGQCEWLKDDQKKTVFHVGQFLAENEFIKEAELMGKIVASGDAYLLELRRELFDKLCDSFPVLRKNQEVLNNQKRPPSASHRALID